ncbi:MAG: hypothetical protein QNK32_02205, partial [Porticoccus sp.]|nr:hypothetical protein [Porticoccus sp.]
MSAYILRRIEPNPDGTRYCMMASADSVTSLYWLVYQIDDPGNYEYRGCVDGIAICFAYSIDIEEDTDEPGKAFEVISEIGTIN